MKTKASLKRLMGLVPAALLAAVIGAAPAWGAEPLQDGFSLWVEQDGEEALRRLDADPSTPGMELIVGGETDSFNDLGTTVQSRIKLFARVVTADGASEIGRLSKRISLWTGAYPDPGVDANQEGGGNETIYGAEVTTTTIPFGFTTAQGVDRIINQAFEFPFGLGFAENDGATTRTIVIGLGIEASYGNPSEPFVEVGTFAFFSFNAVPSAGKFNFLCKKTFAAASGDWELESGEAGVGDFLAGARAGEDEIRVVHINDSTGFARYRYYDPTDCSLLDTVKVRIIS